uniref:Uncharacterized protein n=1 Tax=Ditylenchus dipsaci TaxID=166011 RepID=A0A915E9Z8_9BILA
MQNNQESQSTSAPAKMSFSIIKQTKKAVVKSSFLSNHGIVEIDDEEIHTQKRSIAYLEDGIVKDSDNFPVRKKDKKEYIIPIQPANNNWRIERLKKILNEGTGTDEDKARLELMIDALGGDVHNGIVENQLTERSVYLEKTAKMNQ